MEACCGVRPRILVADDQPAVLESLQMLLGPAGFDLDTTNGGDGLVDALQQRPYDLVLMDMNYSSGTTSGDEGLHLLSRISAIDANLPVVVMTGWSTVELAVATLRAHASNFVQKPWDNQALVAVVRQEIEKGRTRRTQRLLEQRELEEARVIQHQLLPTVLPSIPGWEIAAAWRPARGVTGDYFDAIRLGETRIGICIADVAGKGIPAALLMSSVQAAVRALAPEYGEPRELCARLNRILCDSTSDDRFISLFYGVLDASAGTLTYTNAGHNAPFVVQHDGSIARLSVGGLPLGVFPETSYDQAMVPVCTRDRIVLFTDGITEACTTSNDEFGEQGLAAAFERCGCLTASELKDRIIDALTRTCGASLSDDATLVVVAAG